MAEREWKPGEIWLVECPSWAPGEQRAVRYDAGWYWLDDSDYFINDGIDTPAKRPVTPLRPLLVIDPEDKNLAHRIACLLAEQDGMSIGYGRVQAALRSLLAPPKPDEPMGLGAVVEDANGERWCRWEIAGRHPNPWAVAGAIKGNRTYADIDAVRVLSEGVIA